MQNQIIVGVVYNSHEAEKLLAECDVMVAAYRSATFQRGDQPYTDIVCRDEMGAQAMLRLFPDAHRRPTDSVQAKIVWLTLSRASEEVVAELVARMPDGWGYMNYPLDLNHRLTFTDRMALDH